VHRFKTQVLLLHSEQHTLDRFSASLGDAYSVHLATSGTEALHTLGLTPIHIMVSAQRLPGMSGIEALREARKRSPETLGILIAPEEMSGAEVQALVGKEEVFQIIRGVGTPEQMRRAIDEAVDQLRMNTLSDSANDRSAGPRPKISPTAPPREPAGLRRPPSPPSRTSPGERDRASSAAAAAPATELVVLSKDEVFLDTIRQALSPRQPVHSVDNLREAARLINDSTSAVLVTDAAVAPRDVEAITARLRSRQPRLVTIVAGRRDDGDQLMDLINSGMVYRFLLKPISPGRARLAIEAAIRRAREEAQPAAPAGPQSPPAPAARVEPTLEDFEGAEEVVLSEEAPAPRAAPQPAPVPAKPARKEPKAESARTRPKAEPRRNEPKVEGRRSPPKAEPPGTGSGSVRTSPGLRAIAGLVVALTAAAGIWYALGGDEDTGRSQTTASGPQTLADSAPQARPEPPPPPPVSRDLRQARAAVAEGRLLAPGEDGALTLYARALADAPDDAKLAAEVDQVVAEAVAGVAAALDAGRPGEARASRTVIAASFPAAPGLAALDRRLAEVERDRLLARADELAAAGDTGGAMTVLDEAAALLPGRSPAVEAKRESLLAAADDRGRTLLLELGNQRLLQGDLVEPAADNARYYYRAVLAQDSESIAGRQGMAFLRTALITRIREALEAGDRATAERWLEEARVSGVESARLMPFSEAAANLPRSPAAPAEAPAEAETVPTESAPAAEAPAEATAAQESPAANDSADAAPTEIEAAQQPAAAAVTAAERPAETATMETAPTGQPEQASIESAQPAITDPVATEPPGVDRDPVEPSPADPPAQGVEQTEAAAATSAESAPAPAAAPTAREGRPDEAVAAAGAATTAEPGSDSASASGPESVLEPESGSGSGSGSQPVPQAEAPEPVPTREETVQADAAPPTPPERITYVAPDYPRIAATRGMEGWVDVEFSLTPAGIPEDIAVTDARPAGTFNEAAVDAVGQWRYQPPAESGWPPGERIRIRINFDLNR